MLAATAILCLAQRGTYSHSSIFGGPGQWEVPGSKQGGCRSAGCNEGSYNEEWGLMEEECKTMCQGDSECVAYEWTAIFEFPRCELHKEPVVGTFPMEGYTCRRKPGLAPVEEESIHVCGGAYPPTPPANKGWSLPPAAPLAPAASRYKSLPLVPDPVWCKIDCTEATSNCDRLDFSWMNLDGCDFRGFSFQYSNLRGASFRGAILSRVKFDGADLSGTDFTLANLERASFSATVLEQTVFMDAALQFSAFTNLREGSRASHMIFDGANLANVQFTDAWVSYASFREVEMARFTAEDVRFYQSDFRGVFFVGMKGMVDGWFEKCNLEQANFRGVRLNSADFTEAILRGTVFNEAEVTDANFNGADIREASWTQTMGVSKARFVNCIGDPPHIP